jgi:hypothetical protein
VIFTNLLFLVGALAVAGPLIAHLFAHPRFKRVPFTMLRFLEAGHKETQTQRRLRDLLLLAMRMLILVLLALAFANPLLVSEPQADGRSQYFLGIDDSLSMAYREDGATLLDQAKDDLRAVITEAEPDAVFSLYGLASGAYTDQRPSGDALAFLDSLRPIPARIEMEAFTAAVEKAVDAQERVRVTLASDFTPPVLEALQGGTPLPVDTARFIRAGSGETIDNAAVTSCSVGATMAGDIRFSAVCVNTGTQPIETTVGLLLGETDSGHVAITLAPGERRTVVLDGHLPEGAEHLPVTVQLDSKDGLHEDDAYYGGLSLPRLEERNVLVVAEDTRQGHLLQTALEVLSSAGATERFRVSHVTRQAFDARLLSAMDVVMFASIPPLGTAGDAAGDFLSRGGRLLFYLSTPSDAEALQGWADAGAAPATAMAFHKAPTRLTDRPLSLSGDALDPSGGAPVVLANYDLSRLPLTGFFELSLLPTAEVLWTFERDHPFMVAARTGDGVAVVINTSADDHLGPLMKSSAAVAVCNYLVSGHRTRQMIGFPADEAVMLPATEMEMKAAGSDTAQWAVLPDHSPANARIAGGQLVLNPPLQTGFVATKGLPVRYAGVNVPAEELNLRRPSDEEMDEALAARFTTETTRASREVVVQERGGRSLWRWFMFGALGMVLAEAFVSNRMKR